MYLNQLLFCVLLIYGYRYVCDGECGADSDEWGDQMDKLSVCKPIRKGVRWGTNQLTPWNTGSYMA